MLRIIAMTGALALAVPERHGDDVVPVVTPPSLDAVTMNRQNVELSEAGRFDFDTAILQPIPVPPDFSRDKAFTVRLWFGIAGGSPLQCEPAATAPDLLAKAICDRLTAAARFSFYRGFAQPIDRGFVQLYVYRSSEGDAPPHIAIEPNPAYQRVDLRYPPDTTPEADRIARSDGVLNAGITSGDYPSTALRAELTGRSEVLLGISSDGHLATCRPLRSAGAAVLDNATCAIIMRRGHFNFVPTAKPYEGVRYKTAGMVWALPG